MRRLWEYYRETRCGLHKKRKKRVELVLGVEEKELTLKLGLHRFISVRFSMYFNDHGMFPFS